MTPLTINTPRIAQYWALTKPRVAQLAVFCAVIGMLLASHQTPNWRLIIPASVGIWLLAAAAFAVNCLLEREVDSRMSRTARRPTAKGEISTAQTLLFSGMLGSAGAWILYVLVNPLTMWLTLATFSGYAVIYTVLLKPNTPQNIVIGGLSGAMPPALGWAAIANTVPLEAWLLVLIIFTWTPPHFWALALYRRDDYAQSGLPMLPITHGMKFTQLNVLVYTIILAITTIFPYCVKMSGIFYLCTAIILNTLFLRLSFRLWCNYSDALAKKTFRFSIIYLSILFAALLIDRLLQIIGWQ